VNLTIGAYRDDAGQPFVLQSVRSAEERVLRSAYDHGE
jgi:aspartate/tyrosine/aromatic aminotransferase